jgi:hypothetical protein
MRLLLIDVPARFGMSNLPREVLDQLPPGRQHPMMGVDEQDDRGDGPEEFTDTPQGRRALDDWARRYDELTGAPESEDDR